MMKSINHCQFYHIVIQIFNQIKKLSWTLRILSEWNEFHHWVFKNEIHHQEQFITIKSSHLPYQTIITHQSNTFPQSYSIESISNKKTTCCFSLLGLIFNFNFSFLFLQIVEKLCFRFFEKTHFLFKIVLFDWISFVVYNKENLCDMYHRKKKERREIFFVCFDWLDFGCCHLFSSSWNWTIREWTSYKK